ncbi:unnamed protein product [Penicillium roqueforti FM164]|uniref:Genomic scaffold, ProqFM164S02 n=1 Tax=Penicillium roqueforti (strain FM164) TaxID=1365484 RepID=W6Q6I4_PENRF|nr:unnamed protein product [Penicillium roqueforti FM164]
MEIQFNRRLDFNFKKPINFQHSLETQNEAPANHLRYKDHGIKTSCQAAWPLL